MGVSVACPDSLTLEQFVLGLVQGEQARMLEEHVANCARCGETLAALPGADPLLEAMRQAHQEEETCTAAVRGLIRQIKRMPLENTIFFAGEVPHALPITFDFLEPPREENELGWLGPYRIRKQIGSGGMGMVFLGEDPRLNRQIAVKVIQHGLLQREDIRQSFLREAESVAAVEHDNIVAIYEVNERNGVPYLVMPLLRGESLEDRLQKVGGPLPVEETIRIARQVAEGLAAAHARGIVHRDIKPANIFLCAGDLPGARVDGVKLLDFGLARPLNDDGPEGGAGTPAYMSPEQAAGYTVDARADLFSFGCVFYRMLTGRPAFDGPDVVAVLYRIAMEMPEDPRKVCRKVPAELSRLTLRMLAKKPEDRPSSAQEIVQAMGKIEKRRLSRRRWLFLAGGGMLAAMTGGLATALWRPGTPPPSEVTLELDEAPTPLLLVHGEDTQTIQVDGRLSLTLEPGDYQVRLPDQNAKRRPVPDRFVVQPGQPLTVPLRLVGEVAQHRKHDGSIKAVAIASSKEKLWVLSAGSDRRVGIWDGVPGSIINVFTRHEAPVLAIAVAPDGRRAASGGGGRSRRHSPWFHVRLWDVRTREQIAETSDRSSHTSWVTALAFSSDGKRLASGSADGVVMIRNGLGSHWNRNEKGEVLTLTAGERRGVYGLAFNADDTQLLTAGGNGDIGVWDAASARKLAVLKGHTDVVRSIAIDGRGALALSAGDDGTVRLWNLKTREGRILIQLKGAISQAVFTPDEQRVLSAGEDGMVRLWDVTTGKEVYRFAGHRGAVHGVACSADGRKAVSCGQDGTVRLWELPR